MQLPWSRGLCFGDPNATTFTLPHRNSVVTVAGDEEFARRAKTIQAGDKITIRGTISKAAVWGDTRRSRGCC